MPRLGGSRTGGRRLGPARFGDVGGVLAYAAAFAASSVTTYLFNALLGRRLDGQDFATFVALLGVLLALTGPSTALFGGGAMSSARTGEIPTMPWRTVIAGVAIGAAAIGLSPIGATGRAIGWFALAAALLTASNWIRGLLVGLGRLVYTGVSMVIEGVARIGFAQLLVARGYGAAGAAAGLALGVATGLLLALAGVPRRSAKRRPVNPEVWASIWGLLFVGVVQFVDVVAVRAAGGPRVGPYAAASSIARVAMYAQFPAAAYAVRASAKLGPGRAFRRVAPLALAPAIVAVGLLEVAPRWALQVTYGGHYPGAAGLLRTLTVGMFFAGAATVAINLMLGAGRTAWVWTGSAAAVAGSIAVVAMGGRAGGSARTMKGAQFAVLSVAAVHLRRLLASASGGGRAVLIMNWRDTRHPQGGGSEVFVEEIAKRLVAAGRPVTVFCARYEGAAAEEVRDGIRFVRRGSWRTVYLWGAAYHLLNRFGPHEVVVDVQNAVPFFTPLYCGRPVVVLVHHTHREQWDMLFGPRLGRAGWWVESRLAPRLYRSAAYVTVSSATKSDLIALGVAPERVTIVHNGSPRSASAGWRKSETPTVVFLGRLVPHKRIEVLIDAVASLRSEFPGLRARILGQGAWEPRLRAATRAAGVEEAVSFEGFVDEGTKRRALGEAWLLALPSVREGWGLAVVEAAAEGTPAIAFGVGGLTESIEHGVTGVLVDDRDGFVRELGELLRAPGSIAAMGAAARARCAAFSWDASAEDFGRCLDAASAPPDRIVIPEPAVAEALRGVAPVGLDVSGAG